MFAKMLGIIVSPGVLRQIDKSVIKSEDKYEVGGVVLGKRIGDLFIITKVTLPNTDHPQSSISFELSNDDINQADFFMNKKVFPLCFLGVWHSHTLGLSKLSSSDKESIASIANKYGKTIAILATASYERKIQIDMYFSDFLEYPVKQFKIKRCRK